MNRFLDALVGKLPTAVQPYAKALVPVAVGVFVAAQDLVIDAVEVDELKTLVGAAVVAILTYAVPNAE